MTITSLLDTDLYKLTMQAVVHKHFPSAEVEYLLTNRSSEKHLNAEAVEWIKAQILHLETLTFEDEEIEWLKTAVPFLPKDYYAFLHGFRLNPAQEVDVTFDAASKELKIKVKGLWKHTILYEIPVLAIVSEAFFKFVDTDWDYEGQKEQAAHKAARLVEQVCKFSEFGTRRRRSLKTQDLVIQGILEGLKDEKVKHLAGNFVGTSNVFFAKKYDLKPIGTVAHELFMGVAAFYHNYEKANKTGMDVWLDTVGDKAAGFALTDTFGTLSFLKTFGPPYCDIYFGVRQDSGDPIAYTKLISDFYYKKQGLSPFSKNIIYSDSLNIELCAQYKAAAEKYSLNPSFGIGTFFTNDFHLKSDPSVKSKPLNIVMKLSSVNGYPAVKLSDNIGKNMGPEQEIVKAKKEVGYVDSEFNLDESDRW